MCRKKRPQIEYSLDQLRPIRSRGLADERESAPTDNDLEAAFFRKEVIERLYAAMRALYDSPAEANKAILIFDLYFREGLTVREIAQRQGINRSPASVARLLSTVRSYLNSTLAILAQQGWLKWSGCADPSLNYKNSASGHELRKFDPAPNK